MIEMTSPSRTVEILPTPGPEFTVEPQAPSSFVMPSAIEVFRLNDQPEVQWSAPSEVSSTDDVMSTLEKIIETTRREALRHPKSSRAQINLGQALLNAGFLEAAAGAFRHAYSLHPDDVSALAHLARVRMLEGRPSEAFGLATKIHDLKPTNVIGPMLMASAAMMEHKPETAVESLKIAIRLAGKSWVPHYLLGLIYLGQRQSRDAITHLRSAARNEPRSAAIHHALGVAYSLEGAWRKGDTAFRQALVLAPNRRESLLALAQVLLHRKNHDEAISVLSDWAAKVPNDVDVQELLAHSHYLLADYRSARRHLQLALSALIPQESNAADRARLMNNTGVCAGYLGDFEEAAEWYSKAIQTFATNVAYVNLAKAYRELDKPELARKALLSVSDIDRDAGAQLLNGVLAGELGLVDEAIAILQRVIAENENLSEGFATLGFILADEKRDYAEALSVLSEGHERFPFDVAISNNLAYVNLMLGHVSAAREVLATVSPQEIKDSVFLTATVGLLRLLEGDTELAEQHYMASEKLARGRGRPKLAKAVRQKMHLEFARALMRKGELVEALKHAKRGLSVAARRSYGDDLREIQRSLLAS
jgi:tetratricopeptide (TPR) repeat protein